MYNYWGFGLNITSEVEFPELLLTDLICEPDVCIKLGMVKPYSDCIEMEIGDIRFFTKPNDFFLEVANLSRYHATAGKAIVIEPLLCVDTTDVDKMRLIRLHLLTTVFASILVQRGLIPLHASAVVEDNRLTLVAGDSGSGKSTSIATLIKMGYPIFSDDVIVLQKSLHNQSTMAWASYPMMKLWEDSIQKLSHKQFSDRSYTLRPGVEKYGIFFHENFDDSQMPIGKIIILKKKKSGPISATELTNSDAFLALRNQLYRPMLVYTNQSRAVLMDIIASMVNSCSIYEVQRPEQCEPVELASEISKLPGVKLELEKE